MKKSELGKLPILIASMLLILYYSYVSLSLMTSEFQPPRDSILGELYFHTIAQSFLMILLGVGLLLFSVIVNENLRDDVYFTPGEWTDDKGIQWRRTNGGLLYWWDGSEWIKLQSTT